MRPSPFRLAQAVLEADLPQWMRTVRHQHSLDRKLTHIVSAQLCDDVLPMLIRSLPEPYTCDLLDYNPGPCLWSRKLHAILKPRRHILIEPRKDTFAPFLDPLLNEPKSPYRWAPDLATAMDSQNALLSDDVYNFERDSYRGAKSPHILNERLLLTANLSSRARRAVGFMGSEAKQFLNNYYHSTLIRDQFLHQYGLVRMLAWISEDSRMAVMPTCVNNRTKQSIQLEASCSVTSIAGPSSYRGLSPFQQRWHELDAENQNAVRKTQRQNGIIIAPERRQPDPDPPLTALEPNISDIRAHKDRYPHHQISIQRLLRLDDRLSTEMPAWYADYHEQRQKGFTLKRGPGGASSEMSLYRVMMTEFRTRHATYLKARDFLWEFRRMLRKFKRAWKDGWFLHDAASPVQEYEAEVSQLVKENSFMQAQRLKFKRDTRISVGKALDDYQCYDSNPRVMAWNRRRYDPLLVKDEEFSPSSNPMTLFDITPRIDFLSRIDSMDKLVCFDHVCTALMMEPSGSVAEGIKKLVPAGYSQFLERLPRLKNIERGGWYDLDQISIRTLHHDYIIDIALAFYDWPHRPEIGNMMAVYKGVFDKSLA